VLGAAPRKHAYMAAVLLLTVAAALLATNAMASIAGNGGGGKGGKQAPSTPTGLVVSSAGQTSVTLKWNASTEKVGVAGYGVVGYGVYRNGKRVASSTSTSYTLTGLTCGTQYRVAVDAYDATGNRSSKATVTTSTVGCTSAGTDTQPPTAPTGIALGTRTTTSISITWTASTDNVAVAGYDLYVGSSDVGTAVATASAYTFGGLTCGTDYTLGVEAYDAAGNRSPETTATIGTMPCTDTQPPSTPTGFAVSSAGQTSLTLNWNASTDNVGVVGYGVYSNGKLVASPTSTGYVLTGLSCGTSYSVAVDAYDAAGNRSSQATVTTSTVACPDNQPPTVPTAIAVGSRTTTSISITWTASTDNVGVVGYDLFADPFAGSTKVGTATATAYTFTGLSCGASYTLGVDAYDAAGNRSPEAMVVLSTSACPPDTTPPSTPTGLATSGVGQTGATLSWTASSDNVAVAGYRLYQGSTQVGTAATTSYSFTTLSCGTSYTLGVAAYDAAGNTSGVATITSATATCPTPPSPTQFSGPFNCYGADSSCYTPNACTTTISASSGLDAAISAAAGGTTICLRATGSPYAEIKNTYTKSSDVTIQPYPGDAVTINGITLWGGTNHIVFQGLTINGATTTGITNSKIVHSTFRGSLYMCMGVNCGGVSTQHANVLIDYDSFDGINTALYDGRVTVRGQDGVDGSVSGITISHSHFGAAPGAAHSGCTDGIFFNGNGDAVVGPGNEFSGFSQSNCDPGGGNPTGAHVDPIQFYGEDNATIKGNYFHDNGDSTGGLESFNGDGNTTVTNNVFVCTCSYPYSLAALDAPGWAISHNTFAGGGLVFNDRGSGIFSDNALINGGGVTNAAGTAYTYSFNLNSGMLGTGNINGAAQLVSSPASGYYHYQLNSASPGYQAASDGKSMGIGP
jgi:chitodextrinase